MVGVGGGRRFFRYKGYKNGDKTKSTKKKWLKRGVTYTKKRALINELFSKKKYYKFETNILARWKCKLKCPYTQNNYIKNIVQSWGMSLSFFFCKKKPRNNFKFCEYFERFISGWWKLCTSFDSRAKEQKDDKLKIRALITPRGTVPWR